MNEKSYSKIEELENNLKEQNRICKEICWSLGHEAETPMHCDMQGLLEDVMIAQQSKINEAEELLGQVSLMFLMSGARSGADSHNPIERWMHDFNKWKDGAK